MYAKPLAATAECDQRLCPVDPTVFEKAGETFLMLQSL